MQALLYRALVGTLDLALAVLVCLTQCRLRGCEEDDRVQLLRNARSEPGLAATRLRWRKIVKRI